MTDRSTRIKSEKSQQSDEARRRCATGLNSYVRWRADALSHLDAAITENSHYVLPRLVKSWMLLGSRDASFTHVIDTQISEIQTQVEQGLALEFREKPLFAALAQSRAGRGIEAATLLERYLMDRPTDVLAHQLIQNELFWMGRADWMHDVTERAASHWSESSKDYGPFMSLRAFASEEAGDLCNAEKFGRQAVEIDPSDAWGAHAVAHALLMRGDMQAGINWLQNLSPHWGHANQLRHHLWWHVCLFLLETGDHQRVISLLHSEVRDPESELVKAAPAAGIDIQNYASLLFRLELYGVDVGGLWQTLAEICQARVGNHGNAFCNIHDMMVLCATGQQQHAATMLDSMQQQFQEESGSVALAYQAAGIPACKAIIAYYQNDYDGVLQVLNGVRHDLPLLGASHAQRDVLYHLLVHAARKTGREDLQAVYLRDIERIGFCQVPERAAYRKA